MASMAVASITGAQVLPLCHEIESSIFLECVQEIKTWMHHNFLKIKHSKTEVVLIGSLTKEAILI